MVKAIKHDFARTVFFLTFIIFSLLSVQAKAEAPKIIKGAQTISLEGARLLYDSGAVFIDVRDKDAWALGHIPGALHLDFRDDSFILLHSSKSINKKTPVVFYNDSPLISSGALASFFATDWGYREVYFFREGFFSWMASDYPVQQVAVKAVSSNSGYASSSH